MSQTDELDEYDAELELRLKREYADVFPLFSFCVLTQEATYLCNHFDREFISQANYPLFRITMEDERTVPPQLGQSRASVVTKMGSPVAEFAKGCELHFVLANVSQRLANGVQLRL